MKTPMSQISTPNEWKDYCDAMKKEKCRVYKDPRKQTMALIMQFARTYHVEKNLPASLSGYVIN
ncbi:hypothetical protein FACS1894155_05820 [Bacteroidia bacterium]|nr:hypothetical protein FACS189455_0850 [Bacteroidia bacterium]GHU89252.1 hypothetical protein FACS1894155_05820 [Bacteroidia bacterium]